MGSLIDRLLHRRPYGQRLGQYFVNTYIARPWPELFHEKDEGKAKKMIEIWLADHHYSKQLPNPLPKN